MSWRRFLCYLFHRKHQKVLVPDPYLPWPFDWDKKWWCSICDRDKGRRERPRVQHVALAAGFAMMAVTACSTNQLAAEAMRPPCADKVAKAFTSPKPVPGAYACVVVRLGRDLYNAGIQSDDQWAAFNVKNGRYKDSFHFETVLTDGGYVYTDDAGNDLIVWVDPKVGVTYFDRTGPNG